MAKLETKNKQLNSREFSKILKKNGFEYTGECKGSHMHYRRGKELIVLPSRSCNRMWTRRMVKEFNLEM